MWAHRQPVAAGKGGASPADHVFANVTGERKNGIRNSFLAVREYAQTNSIAE